MTLNFHPCTIPSPMMTPSNGNISCVTRHLCGEFNGPRWIPHTKASDAELWCFLWSAPGKGDKRLSKQWWGWWFETLSCPLWRHPNAWCIIRCFRGECNHPTCGYVFVVDLVLPGCPLVDLYIQIEIWVLSQRPYADIQTHWNICASTCSGLTTIRFNQLNNCLNMCSRYIQHAAAVAETSPSSATDQSGLSGFGGYRWYPTL